MSTQLLEAPEARIRVAIGECMEACHGSLSPVARLAECLEILRDEGWDETEIRRVEVPVLKMLVALMSPDSESREAEAVGVW